MLTNITAKGISSCRFCVIAGWLLTTLFLTGSSVTIAGNEDKPVVISTTTFIHDIARNIGGDAFHFISVMPVGADPHTYDPVPGDIRQMVDADLILQNGLYLEVWLDRLIQNSGTDATVVYTTDGIEPIYSKAFRDSPDPHAWMSAKNGIIYARNIRDALINLKPESKENIESNFKAYRKELEELDQYIREKINAIPEQNRILITTHDAFAYYGKEYGIEVDAVLGISTDADVQIKDVRRIHDIVRDRSVPAIFIESTIDPRLFRQMAGDLNIEIGGELFADSLGDEDEESGTYIGMLRYNTRIIHNALTGEAAGSRFSPLSYGFIFLILIFFTATFIYVARKIHIDTHGDELPSDYAINIRGLNLSFDRKAVLTNIYLNIGKGKIHGLIGPNGAGKTTLIKTMLGLLDQDSGHITLNNTPIHHFRKYIAYIPQKEEVDWTFPATVEDVVLMGRYIHKGVFENINREDIKRTEEAMRVMDIEDLRNRQIGELSGGQQQRVFIARAICQQAEIYLMDEPFVGVDLTTEEKIFRIIKRFADEGKTVVVIHHDLSRVRKYFDDVIMINQRIVAAGNTENVFTDENIRKTYSGKPTLLQQTESYMEPKK